MTTKPIRYILFDVDDTLYPRSSGLLRMIDARIEDYLRARFPLGDEELTEMRRGYWQKYGTTLRGLLLEAKADPDDYLEFIHDVPIEERVPPNPELDRLLARIPAAKAILTNSSREHAQRVLRALGIQRHFHRIFDIRIVDFVGKPDPRVYQHVLEALGVQGPDCLFIDDSPRNILAAAQMGIRTILVGDGRGGEGEHHISDIGDLEDVLAHFQFAPPA